MASHSAEYLSQTKGPKIIGVFWVMAGLTLVMVVSRLYIRAGVLRNMGSDDWLIAASMVMSLAYTSLTTVNVAFGYGRHADTLSPERLVKVSLVNYIDFTLGIVSFSLPKLAVAALLNRIVNPNWWQKAALWILTGLVALTSGVCIIVLFTMCDPPEALWDTSLVMQGATCRNVWILIDYAIFTGAFSAFTDLYLAIYPSVILLRLNMSARKKIALCLALGLGSIACAMAVVKCLQLPGLSNKTDPTYATAELVIWTWYVSLCSQIEIDSRLTMWNGSIESNVVIMASCIPTLHPLLEITLGRRSLRSWSASRDNYKNSSSSMPGASYNRSKRSNPRKPDLTITNVGSQENILRPDELALSQIHRTDNVTVQYESRSGAAEERTSW
ncbi:uncharacterized protein EURHEDRAFT_406167 [Aspergillus ruber CBS 135680]|uniref:Rhodopsin domain-containing protein n=1 Tax=Aspergillus ruber (strain CBS 135680) TaxID=1388766 RepID=A0A017S3A3_ASPRC|nr:uncharacterized protein EURHEDRAFT_406167 [Aspergillus ruber CBS 135680]EYE91326.1 hypothetical protein EURHEDRAFT_406167 [Aspergillus ruber CBS 135680]